MRSLIAAAFISLALMPVAAAQDAETTLHRTDYVRCMGHVERASQAAMLSTPTAKDIDGALACNSRNTLDLSGDRLEAFLDVYRLLKIQLETPSATAHMEIIQAVQKFLRLVE